MKCCNSVWNAETQHFNARGARLIIVVVQVGAVKIYVAAVEALRKKERQNETQFTTKIDGFLSFTPRWIMLMYFFCRLFLNLTLCMTKLRVLVLCLSYFTDNSIMFLEISALYFHVFSLWYPPSITRKIYIYIFIYLFIYIYKQVLCHTVALPFTLKSILRQKKNYANSNI